MDDIPSLIGKTAGLVSLAAFVPYIISILKGETRPERATWFIWLAVGIMLAGSYYASGARTTAWVPISYIIGPFIVSILAIKYGEGGWTLLDRLCFTASLLSGVIWWYTKLPLIALTINVLIDFLGLIPTLRKSYQKPWSESSLAWILSFLASVLNVCAIETWSFAIAVYPVYMLMGNGLVEGLVLIRRDYVRKPKTA